MKNSEILKEGLKAMGPEGSNWYRGLGKGNEITGTCTFLCITKFAMLPETLTKIFGYLGFERDHLKGFQQVWLWNDAPERTFAEVKERFEKAIHLAEVEEHHEVGHWENEGGLPQ